MNCYNGEKYLREALDSVVARTYLNWGLIFWDNQSTDRSTEILKSYGEPRFKKYKDRSGELLLLGLTQMKIQKSLYLYKQGLAFGGNDASGSCTWH